MTRSLFLIFNHSFTKDQSADAMRSLGVDTIISMPEELRELWGNIPPDSDSIKKILSPVKQWLQKTAKPKDYVLVQGDFGACWLMVEFCFKNNLTPIYATTKREAIEERMPDGTIKMVHHFKHQKFRKYGV